MTRTKAARKPAKQHPAWVRCSLCEDFVCSIHQGEHVYDCACPPIERWKQDPYMSGGKPMRRGACQPNQSR